MENQVKNGVEIEVANGVGKWSGEMEWGNGVGIWSGECIEKRMENRIENGMEK